MFFTIQVIYVNKLEKGCFASLPYFEEIIMGHDENTSYFQTEMFKPLIHLTHLCLKGSFVFKKDKTKITFDLFSYLNF